MSNEEQQNGDGGKKIEVKFQKNMKRLIALFTGDAIFKKPRLGGESLQAALTELTADIRKKTIEDFKVRAQAIIDKKREFDRFVLETQKQMDSQVLAKKKEFNKEMDALFGTLEKLENLERDYYQTLKEASKPVEEPATEPTDEEEEEEEKS